MELRITARQLDRLHNWLVQEDGVERFAFLHCSEHRGKLLVETVDPVRDEECTVQHSTGVALDLESELDRLNAALERDQVPVLAHSHPFTELPGFSGQDHEMFDVYREWLGPLYPEQSLGFAVLGRSGMDTTVFESLDRDERDDLPVEVVGDWKGQAQLKVPTTNKSRPAVDTERYDRSIRAFGESGQAELADAHVCIVGVGGLGSMLAEQLARYGVGEMTLVDPDVVEESNLPRIYGAADHHVGRPKVDVVAQHLWQVNPNIAVTTRSTRAQEVAATTLTDCDVLIGAVDRVTARSFLNEFAVKHLRPYLDAGVVIKTETTEGDIGETEPTVTEELGVVQLVIPGVNGCLSCLGRHDPGRARLERLDEDQVKAEIDRGYVEGDVLTPQPAVTPLNGVIASQAVRIVGKLLTGYDTPPDMVQYRGLADNLSSVVTHRDSGCQTCGEDGVLGRGTRTPDIDLVGGVSCDDSDETGQTSEADPAPVASESGPENHISDSAGTEESGDTVATGGTPTTCDPSSIDAEAENTDVGADSVAMTGTADSDPDGEPVPDGSRDVSHDESSNPEDAEQDLATGDARRDEPVPPLAWCGIPLRRFWWWRS